MCKPQAIFIGCQNGKNRDDGTLITLIRQIKTDFLSVIISLIRFIRVLSSAKSKQFSYRIHQFPFGDWHTHYFVVALSIYKINITDNFYQLPVIDFGN